MRNGIWRHWRRWLAATAGAALFLASPSVAQEGDRAKGYISAREFAEAQGIAYQWFPMQKTLVLTRGNRTMHLSVGRSEAVVDDQPFVLPSAPVLQDGQVMVPARSIINVFGAQASQKPVVAAKPPAVIVESAEEGEGELGPDTPAEEDAPPTPVLVAPPRVLPQGAGTAPVPSPVVPPAETAAEPTEEEDQESTLVTVRHSIREDHTRVVLEFDGPMTYAAENAGTGKFKLRINGCKNIIPTKRTNPAGRDLKGVSFHSGPDRKGLVVNFDLLDDAEPPTIETVANPYRMVLSFRSTSAALAAASATAKLAAASSTAQLKAKSATATAQLYPPATSTVAITAATAKTQEPPKTDKPQTPEPAAGEAASREPAKNLKIDVPLETLTRTAFSGRAIVIDPGHGGSDQGVTFSGLAPEKQITMSIAAKLRQILRQMGFNAYLLRAQDTALSPSDRQAAANKAGGDLIVSLHVGGAGDESIEGVACYSYDSNGVSFDGDASAGRISPQNVYGEWTQTTRFDLARFLSMKIRDRLVKHLSSKDRGVRPLPLLPLRFMIYPAVLVEVGMLTNPTEGPKLSSTVYQEAAARSIANGIVDFFNGIKLNP